jgi:hypothetical protein
VIHLTRLFWPSDPKPEWPSARCAARDRNESIADTIDKSRICPVPASKYASAWSRDGLFARYLIVGGGYSPNGSGTMFSPPGHAGQHGWNASSTIWGWHSAADQQRASPGG